MFYQCFFPFTTVMINQLCHYWIGWKQNWCRYMLSCPDASARVGRSFTKGSLHKITRKEIFGFEHPTYSKKLGSICNLHPYFAKIANLKVLRSLKVKTHPAIWLRYIYFFSTQPWHFIFILFLSLPKISYHACQIIIKRI